MYFLRVGEGQCGIWDTETVFIVVQPDVGIEIQRFVDDSFMNGMYPFIVYFQLFKQDGNLLFPSYVDRVEKSQAMGSTKDVGSIRQLTGAMRWELVASDTVGCWLSSDACISFIVCKQAVKRTYPYIS